MLPDFLAPYQRFVSYARERLVRRHVIGSPRSSRWHPGVRLVSDELFTVSLASRDVVVLAGALRAGDVSYVSAAHARYGGRLLGAHPHVGDPPFAGPSDRGPMDLYLELPGDQRCTVVFARDQVTELIRHLTEACDLVDFPHIGE